MTKTKKNKATSKTLVTLLLDRSGSMHSIWSDTIGAINAYMDTFRDSKSDIRFSLVLFDSYGPGMSLEKIFVAEKIKKIKNLKPSDFQPRGGTPLRDAIGTTVAAVSESLASRDEVKVVFAIQTDGQENSSSEYSWESVRSLISEKEKLGWEFTFMGCGIDAYEQAGRLGIDSGKTVSYGKNADQTKAVFEASAMNTRSFAEGLSASTVYSSEQKLRAGDAGQNEGRKADAAPDVTLRGFDIGAFPRASMFGSAAVLKSDEEAARAEKFELVYGEDDGKEE